MIWCLVLPFICLIHFTIEIEIIVVTDLKSNISSLCVDDFDTRVYCTADEKPIKLDNICTSKSSSINEIEIPIQIKPFGWNNLKIYSKELLDWYYWFWDPTIIYLYVYTSQSNVTFEVNINNRSIKFKAQKLNPFQWYDLIIDSNFKTNETKLLNGTLHCLDTLPFTNIDRIRIKSDKLIFWKVGLDEVTSVEKKNTFLFYIYDQGRFVQYDSCEKNFTLHTLFYNEQIQIQMKKRGNWYILPPINDTFKLYGDSACDNSFISNVFRCPYTNYSIYTFKYDPERSISCMVDGKNITVKLKKSSKYSKDITTSIASSIKGNYICTKSGCYCKDGSLGDYCNSECEKYRWGKNCKKTCGKCLNMKECDKMNGECEQCEEGYINSKCKDFVEIEFDVYSKNEKAAWIRWKINNESNYDLFLNINGNQRSVNIEKNCDLWSDYTNYKCSFVNLTTPRMRNIVKMEINIDNKMYAIKSLNVYAKEDSSEPPLNLRQQGKNIIWNHPLITNGQIREFLINVTVLKSGFLENKSVLKWMKIVKQRREYEIQYNLVKTILGFNESGEQDVIQLAPATQYSITVTAFNSLQGKESNALVITTEVTTPITMNQTYDCGKEFEVTNLVRDCEVYLVKTVSSKEQVKSKLPTPIQKAFQLENKNFSSFHYKIDETGLVKSRLGNQSRKITVECVERKTTHASCTVVVINRFNEKESHLLIHIDRVWVSNESTSTGIIICVVLLVLIVVGIGVGIYFKVWTRFNWTPRNRPTLRNTSN